MTPVTDPALIAQLEGGPKPVTDPAILAQLNAPAATSGVVTDPGLIAQLESAPANDFAGASAHASGAVNPDSYLTALSDRGGGVLQSLLGTSQQLEAGAGHQIGEIADIAPQYLRSIDRMFQNNGSEYAPEAIADLQAPVTPDAITAALGGMTESGRINERLGEASSSLERPDSVTQHPLDAASFYIDKALKGLPVIGTAALPGGLATAGALMEGQMYDQAREQGQTVGQATSESLPRAAIQTAAMKIPMSVGAGRATAALTPIIGETAAKAVAENAAARIAGTTVASGAVMPAQTALTDLYETEGLGKKMTLDEFLAHMKDSFFTGLASGPAFAGLGMAGERRARPEPVDNAEALRAALAAFDPNAEHALVAPRAEAPVAPQPPSTNPRASMVSVPTREQVPPSGMAAMSPAVRALMPPEPVVPKQVVQDAPTHSVEESPPPDIPQSDLRDRVLSLRNEIGWDQRGGRAVGNEGGDIVGRSTWQAQAAPTGRPSEFWSARPVKWTPEHATAAFDKFEAGNPLGRRDQAIIDYAHKFAADRQQERQAADEDYIASLERDKQAHDEAQREAIKTAAAAPTEYPTVSTTKSMTLDPQARADQDFEQTLAEHAGEHKLTPEAVSDARARFRPVVPMDPVTGLHTRAGLVDSIKVAQNRAEQGEPATYVEVDARNLGGVNAKAGTEKGGNKYLRDMAGLIERAAKDAGGEALVTRKGGDEFGVVIVGAGRAAVEAAFAKARAEGEQYSIASGMHDAPHKKEGQAPGLGIHYGIADIEPGRDIGNIMSEADTLVERRKIGESYEQPSEIAAPGDVPRSAGKALDRPAGEVGANQIAGGRPAPGVEGQAAGRTAAAEPVANAQPPAPAGLRTPELPAGTEVASAAPERPAAPAAARTPTAAGTPPGRPDVPAARAEGEQAPAPEGAVGISNELTNESRAKRELAPLISSASATDREGWEAAGHRAAVDANHGRRLAAELAKNPRPTTQAETFDLLHEAVRLTDEHDAARAEAARTEGKSEGQIAADLIRLKDIEMQFAQNDVALRSAGTESGAAFRVRKLVSDLNYSVPKQIERMKIATGEEVPAATRAEIEALKAKIDEGNAEIARLTAAKSKPKAEKKTVDERAQERVRAQIKKLEDQIKQRKAACPL